MTKLSGGQAAVEALRAEGTRHVFGLIGSAAMELFDALYDASEINFIGVRDERTVVESPQQRGELLVNHAFRASVAPSVGISIIHGTLGITPLRDGWNRSKAHRR